MHVNSVRIRNFKSLQKCDVALNQDLNIFVGDNEAGKSTLLEAVHLVMSGQINGRSIQNELSPYLFNVDAVKEYVQALNSGTPIPPPTVTIEAYLDDDPVFARLKGTNNELKQNCPGLRLRIVFDDEYKDEYRAYIANPGEVKTIPIEYYKADWLSFAYNPVTSRSISIKSIFIDTTVIRLTSGTDRYVNRVVSTVLDQRQKAELALSYRKLKDTFQQFDGVKRINTHLATQKGHVTKKDLSLSMDMSSRAGWEANVAPHLDDLPLAFSGKGEQSVVNMMLAVQSSEDAHILLIEEPENHLSYSNMSELIRRISEKASGKQLIIATHSSYVLNKLGVQKVTLFNRNKSMKLPGHNTLRLILAQKAILVEGPSDELVVQRAFQDRYGKTPLEAGVDVISVDALAFKRFLEIGILLDLEIRVVTDNDGDIASLTEKYKDYWHYSRIKICFDKDESCKTLEPQLLKANSLSTMNGVLGTSHATDQELLNYMKHNKTDCALRILSSNQKINYPEYIEDAIK
jgi:putative ATP-dependent endonuclease of OLD family